MPRSELSSTKKTLKKWSEFSKESLKNIVSNWLPLGFAPLPLSAVVQSVFHELCSTSIWFQLSVNCSQLYYWRLFRKLCSLFLHWASHLITEGNPADFPLVSSRWLFPVTFWSFICLEMGSRRIFYVAFTGTDDQSIIPRIFLLEYRCDI